ncbi:hypothetical protein SAMN05428949_6537 [Chitinophaga sp. YR627]|uniref:hypothetical protein n=1 Tax=Chitinophaga sp. YR627 TaxID=1881041 RepID=UPI0008F062C9|nr:hypothetical protein [Chitinophaga sp. YR627]SFO76300.1 hypothetical protein SAMN05428949_6537 [Chitinophaga sp. YR627]
MKMKLSIALLLVCCALVFSGFRAGVFSQLTTPAARRAVMNFHVYVDSPSQSYAGLTASIKNESSGVNYPTPVQSKIVSGRQFYEFYASGELGEQFSITVKSGTTVVASGTHIVNATNTNNHHAVVTVYMSY